jgi:hypothetical protein
MDHAIQALEVILNQRPEFLWFRFQTPQYEPPSCTAIR